MVTVTCPLSTLESTMVSSLRDVETNNIKFDNFTFRCDTITDASENTFIKRKKGKWKQHYVGQERTPWGSDCSVCGEWLVIDRLVMNEKYHFCPNCGARMDGEQDGCLNNG